jgi:hypothetical protein
MNKFRISTRLWFLITVLSILLAKTFDERVDDYTRNGVVAVTEALLADNPDAADRLYRDTLSPKARRCRNL